MKKHPISIPRNVIKLSEADAEILRREPAPLKVLVPVTIEPEMCGCGKNPKTETLHSCPYDEDVTNDSMPSCFCCDDCQKVCAEEI
jgi:hypothetical protein